uniref:Receptor ligand binding region domain-containing protein n=1 Tax=Cacopsylla melanoneura TaxID=428564 RepID=A0A8D8M335_9HEMI
MDIRLTNGLESSVKCLTALFLFQILIIPAACLCNEYEAKTTALVNILLDETGGPNCEHIKLGAIQERAAIEYAVHSVNMALKRDGFDIKIQANTFDTCSKVQNIKKMVLKALVTSEQTCPEPPLLLGFIGPQNPDLLNETRKVTNVFSTLHILGVNHEENKYDDPRSRQETEDIVYLYDHYVEHKYEIIDTTLKKLNWASFILVTDESELSVNTGNHFLTARHALQSSNPCVVGDIVRLPRDKADVYMFYKKLLLQLEAGHQDGLVIIVNEMSTILAEFLRKFGTEHPTLLSLNKVGIGAWQVPNNNQFFLLQETSPPEMASEVGPFINRTAFNQFIKQEENEMKSTMCVNKEAVECDKIKLSEDILYNAPFDSSILTPIYTLHLLAATLRSLHRLKCKSEGSNLCPKLITINKADDLNTNIRRATSMYDKELNIRFAMNAEPLVHIYNVDLMDNKLKQVAKVHRSHFELLPNRKLPVKPFPNENPTKRPSCRHPATDLSPALDNELGRNNDGKTRKENTFGGGIDITRNRIPNKDDDARLEDTTVKTIVMSTQTSRPSIWHFIPNVRNIESTDDYVNIAIVLVSAGSAFFIVMICVICCLWKIFRIKTDKGDRDGYDNRSIRSVESGARVRMETRQKKRNSRPMRRNDSERSARSVE